MYCNCLLNSLWCHRFWNLTDLSNQAVFLHDQKFKTKIQISWEQKELLRWNKKYFSSFLKGFRMPKLLSDLWVHLYILDMLFFMDQFSGLIAGIFTTCSCLKLVFTFPYNIYQSGYACALNKHVKSASIRILSH